MKRLYYLPKITKETIEAELKLARRWMQPVRVIFRPAEFEAAKPQPIPGIEYETSDKVKPANMIWITNEAGSILTEAATALGGAIGTALFSLILFWLIFGS